MMENKIPNYLLNKINCIYRNTKVRIKFNGGISEPIYINKGVRQGCGLSPVLFNTYINKILQEFKMVIKKGKQLNNRKIVNTDDQILMATSEDELQTVAYHLKLIARNHKMTISSTKTKSKAMCGNHVERVKIVINNNITGQVTDFKYLGYRISEYKSDLVDKLQTYDKINGAIRRYFGKKFTTLQLK